MMELQIYVKYTVINVIIIDIHIHLNILKTQF